MCPIKACSPPSGPQPASSLGPRDWERYCAGVQTGLRGPLAPLGPKPLSSSWGGASCRQPQARAVRIASPTSSPESSGWTIQSVFPCRKGLGIYSPHPCPLAFSRSQQVGGGGGEGWGWEGSCRVHGTLSTGERVACLTPLCPLDFSACCSFHSRHQKIQDKPQREHYAFIS